jgi:hypothetical protein
LQKVTSQRKLDSLLCENDTAGVYTSMLQRDCGQLARILLVQLSDEG